jgi:hypothetical protein
MSKFLFLLPLQIKTRNLLRFVKTSPVFSLLLALIVLSVLPFYLYQLSRRCQTLFSPKAKTNKVVPVQTKPKLQPDSQQHFKTYWQGFSFQYPASWKRIGYRKTADGFIETLGSVDNTYYLTITSQANLNKNTNQPYTELNQAIAFRTQDKIFKTYSVNNQLLVKTSPYTSSTCGSQSRLIELYFFSSDKKRLYTLTWEMRTLNSQSPPDSGFEVFNPILYSLKLSPK